MSMSFEELIENLKEIASSQNLQQYYDKAKQEGKKAFRRLAEFYYSFSKKDRKQLYEGLIKNKHLQLLSFFKKLDSKKHIYISELLTDIYIGALKLDPCPKNLATLLKRIQVDRIFPEDYLRINILKQTSPAKTLLVFLNAGLKLYPEEATDIASIKKDYSNAQNTLSNYSKQSILYRRCEEEESNPAAKTYYLTAYYTCQLRRAVYAQETETLESVLRLAAEDNISLPLDDALYRAVVIWHKCAGRWGPLSAKGNEQRWSIVNLLLKKGAQPDTSYRCAILITESKKEETELQEDVKLQPATHKLLENRIIVPEPEPIIGKIAHPKSEEDTSDRVASLLKPMTSQVQKSSRHLASISMAKIITLLKNPETQEKIERATTLITEASKKGVELGKKAAVEIEKHSRIAYQKLHASNAVQSAHAHLMQPVQEEHLDKDEDDEMTALLH